MDRSGPASFYMQQRGIGGLGPTGPQSGLNVSPSGAMNPLSNPPVQFQSNMGGGGGGGNGQQQQASMSPLNVGPTSAVAPIGGPVVKRKRGRPRKYGPDGTASLALSPSMSTLSEIKSATGGFNDNFIIGVGGFGAVRHDPTRRSSQS
ncbi:unnamed protein product [Linum trigynum]|uniref:AT-hook motif nuclear-localized protein n=1 Tax=Linum trigynum TaxID=586398 RepID=A0AAV2CG46_9ROSI